MTHIGYASNPRRNFRVAQLIIVPLLSSQEHAIFRGDPHAGNLLYNSRTGDLIIVDWALREHLSREQRRHLALLFLMVAFRDAVGAWTKCWRLASTVFGGHRRVVRRSSS